jgi:hypothetical protein
VRVIRQTQNEAGDRRLLIALMLITVVIGVPYAWFGADAVERATRVALAIMLFGFALVGVGVHRVRIASHGAPTEDDNTHVYTRGAGWVLAGVGALVLSWWVSWPAFDQIVSRVVDSESYRNNFELILITLAVVVVGVCDWFARAWATAGAAKDRLERLPAIDLFAMTLACSIGVVTLTAIGSSVFAARLVQVDFVRTATSLDTSLALDRVLEAAEHDARLAEEIKRSDGAFADAARDWYETEDAFVEARANGNEREAQLAAAAHRQAQGRTDNLVLDMERLDRERRCQRSAIAVLVFDMRSPEAPSDDDGDERADESVNTEGDATQGASIRQTSPSEDAEDERENLCPHKAYELPDFVVATRLMATVAPIGRSWMSSQLARRAPIILSIELVLIMGALGAILRAATPYLLSFAQRDEHDLVPKRRTEEKYLMLTLGLHVVFGMATAFVFFLLLKTGITTVELQAVGATAADTDLNPFTASVLGLVGGYASLNVVAWMGKIAGDLTGGGGNNRDNGDVGDDSQGGAHGGTTSGRGPDTQNEQSVAVSLMLAARDFLKP